MEGVARQIAQPCERSIETSRRGTLLLNSRRLSAATSQAISPVNKTECRGHFRAGGIQRGYELSSCVPQMDRQHSGALSAIEPHSPAQAPLRGSENDIENVRSEPVVLVFNSYYRPVINPIETEMGKKQPQNHHFLRDYRFCPHPTMSEYLPSPRPSR